jgi:hypothetical protein
MPLRGVYEYYGTSAVHPNYVNAFAVQSRAYAAHSMAGGPPGTAAQWF